MALPPRAPDLEACRDATAGGGACRVLHVTEAAGGGVRRHLQRLVPELRALGIGVDLLVGVRRAEAGLAADRRAWEAIGCRTGAFAGGTLPACLFAGAIALRRAVRAWAPDVVHLHAGWAGLFGRLACSLRPPAVVYSPHAFAFQRGRNPVARVLARVLEQALLTRTDALACVSPSEADLASRSLQWPAARLVVAENGLESGFAANLLPRQTVWAAWGLETPSPPLLGFVGRLVPQKDPGLFLEALRLCRCRGVSAQAVVCGVGPLEPALRRQARRDGLDTCVRWLGHREDLPRCHGAFDVVVLPSRYEGLSYTLLEALGAGVPVIASDLPENLPRPDFRGAVTLVAPGRADRLADAIQETLAHLDTARAQAAAAATVIAREFTADAQARVLAALYRSLCAPA